MCLPNLNVYLSTSRNTRPTRQPRVAASPVAPTHAQHCVFNMSSVRPIRPLRQRRHSNARSSRSTSDVCVRQNPGGALARVLAQTPTRRPAGSLVQPACNCKYVHKVPHRTRGWRAIAGPPGWGTPHKTKVPMSVLQSGTFFADFLQRVLLDTYSSRPFRRPRRLRVRLRAGFEHLPSYCTC